MYSVLIVEDSAVVLKVLRHIAQKSLNFDLVYAASRQQAIEAIGTRDNWLAAIVDLNLPDAPNGEMVDETLNRGIPTIVLTGNVNSDNRDALSSRGIVDYVLKEGPFSYQYAVNLVNRLYRNRDIKILVAEDSGVTRKYISELLSRHLFQVIEAKDGDDALQKILADDDIQLLLTDYNMPKKDGFELIHDLRHLHGKTDLVIIGLSSAGDKYLSAKFIKNGANDFLYKPFSNEEFFCRVMQDIESMERLEALREMAYSDPLTGIKNRRYFTEQGRQMLKQAQQQDTPLTLAMLDIDYFKHINDEYGHDVGDEVLIYFTQLLETSFARFLFARTGGEEFCVLFPGLTQERAVQLLDVLREQIEQAFVETAVGDVSFTISGGLAERPVDSLEQLWKRADEALYQAKDAGRNQLMLSLNRDG